MHTHVHLHTCTHATTHTHTHNTRHTHTHTHMYAHTRVHPQARTHTHTCTHTYTCTHARTHRHTQTHTHMHPHHWTIPVLCSQTKPGLVACNNRYNGKSPCLEQFYLLTECWGSLSDYSQFPAKAINISAPPLPPLPKTCRNSWAVRVPPRWGSTTGQPSVGLMTKVYMSVSYTLSSRVITVEHHIPVMEYD